jgi:hypothetical protein
LYQDKSHWGQEKRIQHTLSFSLSYQLAFEIHAIPNLDDLRYGNPRTSQTDAVVGHHDSRAHPSHFIVENWHGQVIIIEFPAGNPTKAVVYTGPLLLGAGPEDIPVTVTFDDVAHNGKPEMILHMQGEQVIFTNGPDDLFHLAMSQPQP